MESEFLSVGSDSSMFSRFVRARLRSLNGCCASDAALTESKQLIKTVLAGVNSSLSSAFCLFAALLPAFSGLLYSNAAQKFFLILLLLP